MATRAGRFTVGRRGQILDQLHDNGPVFVQKLSNQFKVSEVTIRNDPEQLEQKKMLIRARGGAINLEGYVSIDKKIA